MTSLTGSRRRWRKLKLNATLLTWLWCIICHINNQKKEKEWLRDSRRSLCSPFRCFILSITNARRVHPQNPDTINRVLCKTRSLLRHRCQRSVLIKINHFRARHKSVFNAMHQVQQSVWMDATSAANKITRINCIKQRERRQVSLPKKYSLA